ncbi:MAG TPA: hypothetical protein VHA37_00100 [Candidatus Saccharimonadales bacterium]|nr:hypothetical protein [Candidatus Saccharimonadales bacterium]
MTEVLEPVRPIEADGAVAPNVEQARQELAYAVEHHEEYFVSVDGPCPLTDNPKATLAEADRKAAAASGLDGYIALDRECFFKPRTNPADWHGLHSSDPEAAGQMLGQLADRHANVIAEVGSIEQFERYGASLTALWIGGRAVGNTDLIEELAVADPTIVIGVKNGLDGEIDLALEQVARIERLRGDEGAPAVLIYRGGTNAQTPQASQDMYKRAHEATGGRLFYDAAHGVEMAYHPAGEFKKSVAGQVLASEALIQLTEHGYPPLGKFAEASDIDAIMDPHMPLDQALEHSRRVHELKLT